LSALLDKHTPQLHHRALKEKWRTLQTKAQESVASEFILTVLTWQLHA